MTDHAKVRTASERELYIASAKLGRAQNLCDEPRDYSEAEAREILADAEHALWMARRALGVT